MKNDFWLNEWLVQPQLNVIAANGAVVRIEPRVMEVLIHLAEHGGQVVSKESLMRAVWADRFVTDEVITTSIFELRRSLGDEAKNPRFIQTIPKRGYRLIAPVVMASELASQKSETTPRKKASSAQNESGRWSDYLVKPVIAVAVIALLVTVVVLKTAVWPRITESLKNDHSEQLADSHAVNSEVVENYRKGREFWNNRSEEGLKTAIEYFEHAIQLDPGYAPAYTGLADSYMVLEAQNFLRPDEAAPKAKAAVIRALQLDDRLPEAHASMALAKMSYDWDWLGAEEEFKQAIKLNPNHAMAHNWYSQYLLAAGRMDECLREIRLARYLDPGSMPIIMAAGSIYFRLNQYDRALEEFRHAAELKPHDSAVFKSLGHVYEKKSMFDEADAAYKKSVELSGLPPVKRFSHDFARWSKKENAEFLLNKLSFLLKQKYVRPSYIAGLYAQFGETDRAFEWLERAYQERDSNLLFLKTDSTWDSLRTDGRFISFEQRVVPTL